MESKAARRVVEAIGIIGIVGSLIFVGIEIRQNSVTTRAATDAAIADSFRELSVAQATSPALASAFAAHAADPASAPGEAQVLMLGFWRALFHIWSNVHRQHLNGTVDPAIYDSVVREISSYAGPPLTAEPSGEIEVRSRLMSWAWTSERFLFNTDFQEFVDELLVSPPPHTSTAP
ncbi:hypothetical protein [Rubrivirga sp. IMCC43871]|uniref:hypothetical protein n=1 Tax=Rubrivirga sp. IMCC43871 TaxID=3391575 RepID=UPI00398FF557